MVSASGTTPEKADLPGNRSDKEKCTKAKTSKGKALYGPVGQRHCTALKGGAWEVH